MKKSLNQTAPLRKIVSEKNKYSDSGTFIGITEVLKCGHEIDKKFGPTLVRSRRCWKCNTRLSKKALELFY